MVSGKAPDNVEQVLRHPLVMVGSDGSAMAPTGPAGQSRPHPRNYGAFPRVLAHYVRERHALTLPQAVRKMTSMAADQIGIPDRGRIARGKRAARACPLFRWSGTLGVGHLDSCVASPNRTAPAGGETGSRFGPTSGVPGRRAAHAARLE